MAATCWQRLVAKSRSITSSIRRRGDTRDLCQHVLVHGTCIACGCWCSAVCSLGPLQNIAVVTVVMLAPAGHRVVPGEAACCHGAGGGPAGQQLDSPGPGRCHHRGVQRAAGLGGVGVQEDAQGCRHRCCWNHLKLVMPVSMETCLASGSFNVRHWDLAKCHNDPHACLLL
jgi:hypothetical protein